MATAKWHISVGVCHCLENLSRDVHVEFSVH